MRLPKFYDKSDTPLSDILFDLLLLKDNYSKLIDKSYKLLNSPIIFEKNYIPEDSIKLFL